MKIYLNYYVMDHHAQCSMFMVGCARRSFLMMSFIGVSKVNWLHSTKFALQIHTNCTIHLNFQMFSFRVGNRTTNAHHHQIHKTIFHFDRKQIRFFACLSLQFHSILFELLWSVVIVTHFLFFEWDV